MEGLLGKKLNTGNKGGAFQKGFWCGDKGAIWGAPPKNLTPIQREYFFFFAFPFFFC